MLAGSPAARAGVAIGDVLLQIDGRAPLNADNPLLEDDPAFLQPAGTVVRLRVQRGEKRLELEDKTAGYSLEYFAQREKAAQSERPFVLGYWRL